MQLVFRILADLIVILHMAFVAFVVLGLLAVLWGALRNWEWVHNIWFRFLHLAAILLVVLEAWCGVTCPLTAWEHDLRNLAGDTSYEGAFIANLVHELLFFEAPPWVFTLCYTLFGLLVTATFWLIPPRIRRATPEGGPPATAHRSPSPGRPEE